MGDLIRSNGGGGSLVRQLVQEALSEGQRVVRVTDSRERSDHIIQRENETEYVNRSRVIRVYEFGD